MNQQEFERIYAKLTHRRQQVLQRLLQGETDTSIAESMKIGQTTVRKHIERSCQEFGLDDRTQPGRRSRRSELVALFAKYKPELLNKRTFDNAKDVEIIETIETQQQATTKAVAFNQPLINKTLQFQDKFNEFFNEFCRQYMSQNVIQSDIVMKFQKCTNERDIAKLLNHQGLQYYKESHLAAASFYLQWAIEFNPDLPEAHYNLGLVYEGQNYFEEARHHYNIATTILGKENNHAAFAAINNLSRLLIIQDSSQSQVVIDMIEPILVQVQGKKMIQVSLFKNLGWAYFQKGNYKKAKHNLLQSLELDQGYAPAYCLMAKVLEAENNKAGALEFWQKFLDSYTDGTRFNYLPELTGWKSDAHRALKSSII